MKLRKENLLKFLETDAGYNTLRKADKAAYKEFVSAVKYYVGLPDKRFFKSRTFEKAVTNAKTAYVTLNTIMGGDTSEIDRFKEGKKQIPQLITKDGVLKMLDLFTILCTYGNEMGDSGIPEITKILCRDSEVNDGIGVINSLTSTSKLSIDELVALGYGEKNNLAICEYVIEKGVIVIEMESLGIDYPKPEEKEVLLLPGNKVEISLIGENDEYLGVDGKAAKIYQVRVSRPDFSKVEGDEYELKKILLDEKNLRETRKFFEALNKEGEFPKIPESYKIWKEAFQNLVFLNMRKIIE